MGFFLHDLLASIREEIAQLSELPPSLNKSEEAQAVGATSAGTGTGGPT